MVDFHRLKNLGTDIIGRAGDIAEQAKDKVAPLAEQAKEKVVPLAGKAKDVAAKGVDKAAGGLDSATGHKYHDKIGAVAGNRDKSSATDTAQTASPPDPHTEDLDAGIVADTVDRPDTATADTALARDAEATADPATEAPVIEALATEDHAVDDGNPVDSSQVDDGGPVDGGLADRTPTPADMPPHRPGDDAS
jgi:hypothetical protein